MAGDKIDANDVSGTLESVRFWKTSPYVGSVSLWWSALGRIFNVFSYSGVYLAYIVTGREKRFCFGPFFFGQTRFEPSSTAIMQYLASGTWRAGWTSVIKGLVRARGHK